MTPDEIIEALEDISDALNEYMVFDDDGDLARFTKAIDIIISDYEKR